MNDEGYIPQDDPTSQDPQDDGVLRLSRKRKECLVELEDPDTGSVSHYILREFLGGVREQHMDEQVKRMVMDGSGNVIGVKSYLGSESNLVARCLFEITSNGQERPVSMKAVQSFAAHVQVELADKAREICGLNVDEAEEEAKND